MTMTSKLDCNCRECNEDADDLRKIMGAAFQVWQDRMQARGRTEPACAVIAHHKILRDTFFMNCRMMTQCGPDGQEFAVIALEEMCASSAGALATYYGPATPKPEPEAEKKNRTRIRKRRRDT